MLTVSILPEQNYNPPRQLSAMSMFTKLEADKADSPFVQTIETSDNCN